METYMDQLNNPLVEQAAAAGIENFKNTLGQFPDRFQLLH